jgi:GGDEF domain-containing protein
LSDRQQAWQAISATGITVGPHLVSVRASVGYAAARLGLGVRDLLHHADLAMYQAKTSTSGVAAYSPTAVDNTRRPGRRCRDRRSW